MSRTPATPDPDVTAPAGAGAGESQAGQVQGGATAAWLFAPGQLLAGRYRVRAFIARGGMGEVYEAEDEELRVAIAVKALLPAGDPELREARLSRELVLARRVTHPAVCRAFDVAHERIAGGRFTVPFVTMELLRGDTLAAHLAGAGPLPLERVTPIVEQLVAGLDAAHAAGVIHRDFKPANVILTDGGRVVITDFGLARVMVPGSSGGGSSTSDFAGTPAYMAPEQVLDDPVSPATDVYSLGLTIFEMVTGTRAFEAESPLALAMARVRNEAPRATTRVRDLDPRWDAAIAKCLAREPTDRFARAGDVLAALRADVPIAITARRRGARVRRRALVALAAGAALTASAVVGLLVTRGAGQTRHDPDQFERYPTGAVAMMGVIGAEPEGVVNQIVVGPDGDLYLAGVARGTLGLAGRSAATSPTDEHGFIARLSPLGRVRWIRLATRRGDMVKAVGLVLVGDTVAAVGTHHQGVDLGELRLAPGRAGSWIATFDGVTGQPRWLSSFDDHVTDSASVATDGRAIYVATGATDGTRPGDAGRGGRLTLGAYAVDGAQLWRVESELGGWLGGVELAAQKNALVVAATVHGRLALEGMAFEARGDTDIAVASFDVASGAMRWARSLGGPGGDGVGGLAILRDGRVVIAAAYQDEIEVVPGDVHRAVGGRDALVAVLAADGTPQSAWTVGGIGNDVWSTVVVEGDHVILAGEGDPGFPLGAPALGLLDAHRIVVARASLDGRETTSTAFGDLATTVTDVTLDGDGNLYVGGSARALEIEGRRLRSNTFDGFLLELRPPWRPRP